MSSQEEADRVPDDKPPVELSPLELGADKVAFLPPELHVVDTAEEAEHDWPATALRVAANGLSLSRAVAGPALAYWIGTHPYPIETWKPAITLGVLAVTDWADGKCARMAAERDGRRNPLGGWLDQLSDKIEVNPILVALAIASALHGRMGVAVVEAVASAAIIERDIRVTGERIKAERSTAPIDTDAKTLGKIKAAILQADLPLLASPLAKLPAVSRAGAAILAFSAAIARRSGRKYGRAYAAARTQSADAA